MWAQSGEQLYAENCSGCHGKNGDGKTNYAKKARVPDLRAKDIQAKPNEDLFALIARGQGHVSYPHAYELRGMSRDKIILLVQHIKTLK